MPRGSAEASPSAAGAAPTAIRVATNVKGKTLRIMATAFLVIGATLYFIGTVFGIEAADVDYLAGFAGAMTSSSNPDVALWIMWVSLVGVGLVAGWLFLRALNSASRSMGRQLSTEPLPPQKQAPAA